VQRAIDTALRRQRGGRCDLLVDRYARPHVAAHLAA
jgi:hypothetical protein